jgi:glucitol operon activator protein
MREYWPFFLVFALVWALQIWSSHTQAQRFMREVKQLRSRGRTAIGVSDQSRIKPRVFVAISASQDRVVDAVELRGTTVFAKPRQLAELEGHELTELARQQDGDRRARAAAMAARTLLRETASVGT